MLKKSVVLQFLGMQSLGVVGLLLPFYFSVDRLFKRYHIMCYIFQIGHSQVYESVAISRIKKELLCT